MQFIYVFLHAFANKNIGEKKCDIKIKCIIFLSYSDSTLDYISNVG